jgi:hypothetical protein
MLFWLLGFCDAAGCSDSLTCLSTSSRTRRSSSIDGLANQQDPLRRPIEWPLPDENDDVAGEDTSRQKLLVEFLLGFKKTWTVGRLSLLLLVFVTFTDAAVRIMHDQIHLIDHIHYDALSPDVIRPAFLYKSSQHVEKPKLGLGSAAISSITDALSPILPFTGGVDLRRKEYYDSPNWFENIQNVVRETFDAYANAKSAALEEEPDSAPVAKKGKATKGNAAKSSKEKAARTSALSASQPFVPLTEIAQLTLSEIATTFEYAMKTNQAGFNEGKFRNSAPPRVKPVLEAMDKAVAKSRCKDIKAAQTTTDAGTGNMDVFYFCAAMRIFAEWRIQRLVPDDGYKGFAVGMQLGHKDVVQNLLKIEHASHDYVDYLIDMGVPEGDIRSPTLRDVLQYEIDVGIQPAEKLPRLKESSGGMGLLWVRRQLHYQTAIFEKLLDVPQKFPTSTDAVAAAYTEVYDKFHGWAVQKIFNYSFQASPDIEIIYKFMNPHKLVEVMELARHMKPSSSAQDESVAGVEQEKVKDLRGPPSNPFHRIGYEFDKIVHSVGQVFDKANAKKLQVRGGGQASGEGLQGDELDEFICNEMSQDVYEHVASYLEIVQPLLDSLAGLFSELNMDDPSKV